MKDVRVTFGLNKSSFGRGVPEDVNDAGWPIITIQVPPPYGLTAIGGGLVELSFIIHKGSGPLYFSDFYENEAHYIIKYLRDWFADVAQGLEKKK